MNAASSASSNNNDATYSGPIPNAAATAASANGTAAKGISRTQLASLANKASQAELS